jgi:hypothetical protein
VAAFLLLASCAKEPEPSGSGIQMLLAPTLAGDTKGSLTTADLTDFYLQVVSDDTAFSYFEHASKDGSGVWTTPTKLFWKDETTPVSCCAARFGAYAFTADDFKNGVLLELPVDQHTQELLNSADLLTMAAANKKYVETTGGILPVTLAHGLAKVTFTLTLGPKFYENHYTRGENPVKDFTVSGTNACFNFKPQTGAVTAKADTPANIFPLAGAFTPATAEAQNATATYEAILVPQSLAAGALKVTFRVGAYDYGWSNDAAVTLEPGKTYDLTVSVTTAPPDPYNGHEFVDLGLPSGLKWATCNVGATKPEEYGYHFAWGETTTKDIYSWSTYTYNPSGDGETFTKYTTLGAVLEASDDAASVTWGGLWRTPTDAEWTELRDNCTSCWTTQNGVIGRLFTSDKNGSTLFLPAAGITDITGLCDFGSIGWYWASNIGDDPIFACHLFFTSEIISSPKNLNRFYGLSVRPVSK